MDNEIKVRKYYDFKSGDICPANIVGVSDRDLACMLESSSSDDFFYFDRESEKAEFSVNGVSGILDCKTGKIDFSSLSLNFDVVDLFKSFREGFVPANISSKSVLSANDIDTVKRIDAAVKEAKFCYFGHQLVRCYDAYTDLRNKYSNMIETGLAAEEKCNENRFRNLDANTAWGIGLFVNYDILQDNVCTPEFKEAFRTYVNSSKEFVASLEKFTFQMDKMRNIIDKKHLHFDSFDKDATFKCLCNTDSLFYELVPTLSSEEELNGRFRCGAGCVVRQLGIFTYAPKFQENISEMKSDCLKGKVFLSDNVVENNVTNGISSFYSDEKISDIFYALGNKGDYNNLECFVRDVIMNSLECKFGTYGVFASSFGQQVFLESYFNTLADKNLAGTIFDVNNNAGSMIDFSRLANSCLFSSRDYDFVHSIKIDEKGIIPAYNELSHKTIKEDFNSIKVLYNRDVAEELSYSKNEGFFRNRDIPENALKFSSSLGRKMYERFQDVASRKHDFHKDLVNDFMAEASDLFVSDKKNMTAGIYRRMCACVAAITRPLCTSSYIRKCAIMSVAENCDIPEFQKAKEEFLQKHGSRFNQLKRCFAFDEVTKTVPLAVPDIVSCRKMCKELVKIPVSDADAMIKKIADMVVKNTDINSFDVSTLSLVCRKTAYIACMVLDDKVLYNDASYKAKTRQESLDMCKSICLKSSLIAKNSFDEKIRQ